MKTEQEQIEEMSNIITDCLCKNCDDCKYYNGHFCTEKDTGRAEALTQAGYGNVSEYKAEIERLRTTLGQCNTELNSALKSLKSQCREIGKLRAEVKRAQVDTINTIVKYCETPNHWNELKDCKLWGGKSDDLRNFLNGIFKEVENDK